MNIAAWLRNIGLEQYQTAFHDHAIDSAILTRLTSQDLKDIGVDLVGHRRKLLDAIAELSSASADLSANEPRATPRPPSRQSEAERRQLTVLCCDVVGSTALTGRLDPEDMSELIKAVLTAVTAVVAQFDGYVARFTGDGALVYFGYPRAHEDDAERAVRAGLGIVEAVRGVGRDRQIDLSLRVGIATGRVVVGELFGEGAAQERAVVGGTPNLASRLQAIAQPDAVVIAANTRRLLGTLFELNELGPHELKGFAEPVLAWEVIREGSHASRFEAARSDAMMPLIGRVEQVALMLDRWRLATAGRGQVVLLSGEAGIGKSRVSQELREQIRGEPHVALRYQCSPHHSNQPFYPVIGQIWHAAGFSAGEAASDRLDKLEEMIARSRLDPANVAPYLAALLSISTQGRYDALDLEPSIVKERTIAALIAMLGGLSRTAPVLFLLEDAHWIDPTTLELVSRAIDYLPGLRVLAVITFRPEFKSPWLDVPHASSVVLNRFERRAACELVEAVTGGKPLPAEVLEQIIVKTDGVPLFIEELTKAVLGSGLVREEDREYVLAGPLTPFAIPSTLHDSLMARLDRLGPVKEVAQIGAAIGREFSYQLIEAVAPLRTAALHDALRQLVASELIYLHAAPQGLIYVFKHALVQETAYATLLRSRRQGIHADIAQVLAKQFKDQAESAPEIIAHHYTEAGLAEPAARYWLAAAEGALSRSANTEGDRYALAGVALLARLPEGPERRHLELGLQAARGHAALALKGYTAGETVEILMLVKGILDSGIGTDMQRFAVLYGLWAAHYVAGRIGIARDLAKQYSEVADRQGDPIYRMIGQRIAGAALVAAGQHDEGLLSLEAAERHRDPARQKPLSYRFGQDIGLSILCHKVWALWFLGYPDRAARLTEQILSELPDHGHAVTVAFCTLYGAIFPAIFAGDFETAARLGADLIACCTRHKMGPHYAAAGRLCIAVSRGIGDPTSDNIRAIRGEMQTLHEFGVYVLDSPITATLAQILLDAGDVAGAEVVLRDGIAFVEESGERYWLAELHRLNGRAALRGPVPDAARAAAHLAEAMAVARQQKARPLEARAITDLVALRRQAGLTGDDLALSVNPNDAIEGREILVDARKPRDVLAVISERSSEHREDTWAD
jgi:class 3 adenylate cyclase/predicted ATPase